MHNIIITLILLGLLLFSQQSNFESFIPAAISERETVSACPQKNYYVSPDGSDENDGSINAPFASLERARHSIRNLKSAHGIEGSVNIYLREGIYFLHDRFLLNEIDSGTDEFPVVWQSYPDETAIISGGIPLNLNWRVYQGDILVTDVSLDFNSLFTEDVRLTRARTPDSGYFQVAESCNSIECDPYKTIKYQQGDINPDWQGSDADMQIVSLSSFSQSRQRIKKINNGKIETEFWASHKHNDRYYIENFFEALDSPGEWYLDTDDNKLYLWPLGDINSKQLIAANLSELLRIEGIQIPAKNIHFKNIVFAHTDWKLDSHSEAPGCAGNCSKGYRGSYGGIYLKQPAGITLENTQNVVFENDVIKNFGASGIHVNRSKDTKIVKSKLYNIGAGGIRIGETHEDCPYGDLNTNSDVYNCYQSRAIFTPITDWSSTTLIADNLIHDIGIVYKEGVGIQVLFSHATTIEHNEVFNAPYAGISLGWTFTGGGTIDDSTDTVVTYGNLIKKNKIYHVLQELDDGGAIYTLGYQPNTIVIDNVILDLIEDARDVNDKRNARFGIYLDEGSRDIEVKNNLIGSTTPRAASSTAPLYMHGTFFNVIENNIFADGQYLLLNFTDRFHENNKNHTDPDLVLSPQGNRFLRNIVFGSKDYQDKIFEDAYKKHHALSDSNWNLFYPLKNHAIGGISWWKIINPQFEANSIDIDPLFLDPSNGKYVLQLNSPAFSIGFAPFDYSDAGPRNYKHRPPS